jgi:hypothetical protein
MAKDRGELMAANALLTAQAYITKAIKDLEYASRKVRDDGAREVLQSFVHQLTKIHEDIDNV